MPIYEFACPKCRKIYNFLSRRVNPDHLPVCPKCGHKKLEKQLSRFALSRNAKEPSAEGPMPEADFDNPRMARAMAEIERDIKHLDESNPRHMAQLMRK